MGPGAKVAQYVKRWPSDLALPGSSPTRGEISTVNGVSLHTAFHYHPAHHPDMTEILMKRT